MSALSGMCFCHALTNPLSGYRSLRAMSCIAPLTPVFVFVFVLPTTMVTWNHFSSVQSLSRVWPFATPWTAACQASLSITNSQSLLKLMFIELVVLSSHPILCHSPSPPALNLPQHQGLFKWVSSLHQVAKVLELEHQSFRWILKTDSF